MSLVLASKDYQGSVVITKTLGSGVSAIGTSWTIPTATVNASNPINTSFPALINASASLRSAVLGKRTPNITISTMLKPSFCSSALFNDLVLSADANFDSDQFSISVKDGEGNIRYFSGSRCAGISISANGMGGPIQVVFSFLSQYGDSDGSPVTFTPGVSDPGYLTPVSQVAFGTSPTADGVTGWSLNLLRAQGYIFYLDSTLFSAYVASGMFSGSFSLNQSPRADLIPSTAATIQLGQTGSGIQISMALVLNAFQRNMAASLGSISNTYSLVDLTSAGAGAPCTITSF